MSFQTSERIQRSLEAFFVARGQGGAFFPQALVVRTYHGTWHRVDIWGLVPLEAELGTGIQMNVMH